MGQNILKGSPVKEGVSYLHIFISIYFTQYDCTLYYEIYIIYWSLSVSVSPLSGVFMLFWALVIFNWGHYFFRHILERQPTTNPCWRAKTKSIRKFSKPEGNSQTPVPLSRRCLNWTSDSRYSCELGLAKERFVVGNKPDGFVSLMHVFSSKYKPNFSVKLPCSRL